MIQLICGISKYDTNGVIYKTEIVPQIQKKRIMVNKGKGRRDKLGAWDLNMHTIIYIIDNQQESTV